MRKKHAGQVSPDTLAPVAPSRAAEIDSRIRDAEQRHMVALGLTAKIVANTRDLLAESKTNHFEERLRGLRDAAAQGRIAS